MRKKIKKLDFVDRSRYKEGVSFDAKYAVLHFAHNSKKINLKKLSNAIIDSGFTPVYLYEFNGKKLVKTELNN